MSEDNTITIDLTKSINAHDFGAGHIIHKAEFDSIVQEVTKRIELLPDLDKLKPTCGKDEALIHHHDAFTIYGTRGSGKTSFLYSLRAEFSGDNDEQKKKAGKEVKNLNLCVLPMVDPTLIEEKGHIFLTIISLIDDVVQKKLDICCGSNTNEKKEWKEKMRKLAAGLPSINDNHDPINDWSDAEHVMNQGLTRVKSAFNLARHFHELVEYALTLLKQNAFVLMLDDIDINFAKGWPTLETIRKYLTTPRILTFVSGDMQLFSTAIRKKQWENFGDNLLKNEGERLKRINQYNEQVNEMESQYLLKVLKPPYRTYLKTLYELTKDSSTRLIIVEFGDDKKTETLCDFYTERFKKFGLRSSRSQAIFRDFVLNLPIRSQILYMGAIASKINSSNTYKSLDIFISSFYEYGIDANNQLTNTSIISTALRFLLQNKLSKTAADFIPSTDNISKNSVLSAIGFIFGHISQFNPSLILDYFICIGEMHNLTETRSAEELERIARYASIFDNAPPTEVVGYMTAYQRQDFTNPTPGALRIKRLNIKAKQSNNSDGNKGRIDPILKDVTYEQRILVSLPLSLSVFSRKQQSITNYSIYSLLAAISEIVQVTESIPLRIDSKYSRKECSLVISKIHDLGLIKSYLIPDNPSQFSTEGDASEFSLNDMLYKLNPSISGSAWFYGNAIINWCKSAQISSVHPSLLYRVNKRIHRAFKQLEKDEQFTSKSTTLAAAFQKRIVVFLNACLVEESNENSSTPINNNSTSNIDILISKLGSVNLGKVPLTTWLLTCPLFSFFLEKPLWLNSTPTIKDLKRDKTYNSLRINIYEFLDSIHIIPKQQSHEEKVIDQLHRSIEILNNQMTNTMHEFKFLSHYIDDSKYSYKETLSRMQKIEKQQEQLQKTIIEELKKNAKPRLLKTKYRDSIQHIHDFGYDKIQLIHMEEEERIRIFRQIFNEPSKTTIDNFMSWWITNNDF